MRLLSAATLLIFAGLGPGALRADDNLLAGAASALNSAKTLSTIYTVQRIGDAPVTYEVELSKPNKLRIDSPSQLIVADGISITTYNKADKSFDKRPETDAELKTILGSGDMVLLRPFFDPTFASTYSATNQPHKKELRGVTYDAISASAAGKSITFYIDPADKFAKIAQIDGSSGTTSERILVLTTDFKVDGPISDDQFAFVPPAGAKNMSADAPLKLPRDKMPNLDQYKTIPDLGLRSCCPTSTADALAWLSMNGFDDLAPQGTADERAVELDHELVTYYKTDNTIGTTWDNMFPGLLDFLKDKGYRRSKLHLYYWEMNPKWPVEQTGTDMPDLDIIKKANTRNSVVLLAIGWFNNPDAKGYCTRDNWHWAAVTDADPSSGTITLHDPDHEFNKQSLPLTLRYTKLPSDTNILLSGKTQFNTKDKSGAGVPVLEHYPNVKATQFAVVEGVLVVTVAK